MNAERTLETFVCERCKGTQPNFYTGRCSQCDFPIEDFGYCLKCEEYFSIPLGNSCPKDGTKLVRHKSATDLIRLVNAVIDLLIFSFGLGLLINFLSAGNVQSFENSNPFAFRLLRCASVGAWFLYYLVFEFLWQRTPAKFITGTKVIDTDGGKPTLSMIMKRTLVRLIPFEGISFAGRKAYGWHDKWSHTFVVRSRKSETETYNPTTRLGEKSGQLQVALAAVNQCEMEGARSEVENCKESLSPAAPLVKKTFTVPPSKNEAKLYALAVLVTVLIGIIIVRFSNTPSATWANKINFFTSEQKRDLSTPSSRLVGHWKNVNGGADLYFDFIDPQLKVGTFIISNNDGNFPIQFRILSEDVTGENIRAREFFQDTSWEVQFCVPKDGQSMTKENIWSNGSHTLLVYRYVDVRVEPSSGFIPDHHR